VEETQMASMNRRGGSRQMPVAAMVPAIALAAAGGYALYRSMSNDGGRRRYTGDAPHISLRNKRTQRELAHAVVTINRPRDELYAYWRDFKNLPNFIENVISVEETGELSRWKIKAPGEMDVTIISRITQDVEGESITWASTSQSDIRNAGRVQFKDDSQGRGTIVTVRIAYDPHFGTAGKYAARLMGREPQLQAKRELRRFKQLMETGEIATNKPRPDHEEHE
jgi:uncharacterized membrane protein